MIAIISPSLTMEECSDNYTNLTIPFQVDMAKKIVSRINELDIQNIKSIMNINEKLATINKLRYKKIKFDNNGSPAILSYTGTVYKNINASIFDSEEIEFCKKHVRILSGLYGILKPYDSIYEYRLELKTKIDIENSNNLYDYFGNSIYKCLISKDREIVNLCSGEYSKAIIPYLTNEDKFITCSFKINKNGVLKTFATDAKATRGRMINFIVKNKINNVELLKNFNENGYVFKEELSNDSEYVFAK